MVTEYQIRVQVIATADDDGADAANISASTITSRLVTVNQIFSPATVKFVFDEADDFLKINSTLLNRDFTPLEPPNVGSDKWDHEPVVDKESHTRARTGLCKQFPRKLVIIFRNRKKLDQDANGNWEVVGKGGGSSSAGSLFVNMSTSSNGTDLGHEIGHYLQLPHTFSGGVETVADAAAKIKSYVENGHDRDDGLDALDGDRGVFLDTPADCKADIFVSEGLDKCGPVGEITIPVDFGDETRNYTLKPDRNLVMSYFKGCSATGAKTISAEQARRVRDGLELRHRHALIAVKPSLSHKIARGATATGGAIAEVDTALVRAGRLVTAVRDGSGKIKVIVWDLEDAGNKITRRGDATGGDVKKVAVCGIGANMVATAVITAADEMKIIIWRISESGQVTRRGDATLEGKITDLACCAARYDLGASHLATAVRRNDGTLRVDVWKTFADGSITRRADATAGNVNAARTGLNTPRLVISEAGGQSLITYIRDDDGNFKPILWKFEDDKLTRQSSATGASSVGKIAGCNVAREVAVAAVEDKDKKLKLLAYGLPDDGSFIEPRGTVSAGGIDDVDICRLGTEMVLTGVRVAGEKLKMILWQVTPTGDHIIRLDDASTNDVYSRLSLCYTNRNEAATTMRDAEGKLKIVVWRIAASLTFNPDIDVFQPLFINAPRVKALDLAQGGECVDNI